MKNCERTVEKGFQSDVSYGRKQKNRIERGPDRVRRGRVRVGVRKESEAEDGMGRKKREASPTGIYHWIVRGMNKKRLFHDAEDHARFQGLVLQYRDTYQIKIHHYCQMTNHVHMLLKAESLEDLANFSHYVQRRYAYAYCGKYKWNGSVFRQGYKSLPIDREEYLLECGRYIEQNPVKAKMVNEAGEYAFSSYRYYANGEADRLVDSSPAFMGLATDPIVRQQLYAAYVNAVRVQEEMLERGLLPAIEKA